jgi:hypothetical protein
MIDGSAVGIEVWNEAPQWVIIDMIQSTHNVESRYKGANADRGIRQPERAAFA